MCSNGTTSPHFAQTRWYLMRPWSSSWSWLNERLFSSVAGKTLMGMDTSPKEIAPFHMVLGMALRLSSRASDCTGRGGRYQHLSL